MMSRIHRFNGELMAHNRIRRIITATDDERDAYLDAIGWDDNPFAHAATMDEYVIPSEGTVADIAAHIRDYTGPVLIHSRYSGVGKTTLLDMLLHSFGNEATTIEVGEHNVTAYELAGIIADELGVGKSSSTKLTETKIRNTLTDADQPVILGIDEFGLNDKETLHTVQYLNDLPSTRIIMTGMTSQWEAIGNIGSDGRAFRRRVSHVVQLEPFTREQTTELVKRRIASVTDYDHNETESIPADPITEGAIDMVHARSRGIPAVVTAAFAKLVSLAGYRHSQTGNPSIDADLAENIEYADPVADSQDDGVETSDRQQSTANPTSH